MKELHRNLLMTAAVMATGAAASKALEGAWELGTDQAAPKNPEQPGVGWGSALAWGATAGLLAGVAKTATRKGVTRLVR